MTETPDSTPPPGPPPTTPPPGPPSYSYTAAAGDLARLPIPGNAEFLFWLVVEILFAIITLASDDVDAELFVRATAAVSFAYLISRGIAKASRVLEH